MDTLEIEVKFFLKDVEATRARIKEISTRSKKRVFEHNICFETSDNDLYSTGSLLRLRKDNKNTLTYKTRPVIDDPEFKVLEEFEVDVGDFETMQTILGALGFQPSFVYEKYRETFSLDPAVICVDRMPFGDFIEIESNKDDIRTIARQLGLKWPERIVLNYRSMFDIIKKELNLTFSDITFENFKRVEMEIRRFIPRFTGGD